MSESVEVLHRCQNCGNGLSSEGAYMLYCEFAGDHVREAVESGRWNDLRNEILADAGLFAEALYQKIWQDRKAETGLWAE